jgi:Protein of unknown function (DUF1097)
MSLITALAISIGALGGVATFLFLSPIGFGLQIWAAFIAWACFFHCGGKEAGLSKTIIHNVFGIVMGWIALLLVTQVPLASTIGLPLWAGICVAITVFILVMAANNFSLSDIPASVFGYATLVAYGLAGNKLDALTAASLANPLVNIVLSMIIGALFGYASEKVAGALSQPEQAAAAKT